MSDQPPRESVPPEPISKHQLLGGITLLLLVGLGIAVFCGYISTAKASALAPILLAIITLAYVGFTQQLVAETRRGRVQRVKPILRVETDRYGPKIVNRGLGPATNVVAEWSFPDAEDELRHHEEVDLLKPDVAEYITKEPYTNLVHQSDSIHQNYQEVAVTVSWYDLFDNPDSEKFTYETEDLISDEFTTGETLEDIESALRDIEKQLMLLREAGNSQVPEQSNEDGEPE